jgi:proton-translocating NADH-quinone oxidoreductase chain N
LVGEKLFEAALDAILFFMVTSPLVGWIGQKIRIERIRDGYAILGFAIAAYFLLDLYARVQKSGVVVTKYLSFNPPFGACLEVDMFSVFMAFVFVMLSIFVSAYSVRYMERDANLVEYYTLFLGMVAGMLGVVFAGDFFTFFVFWELMCVSSYVLVAFRKERWGPIEAAFKFLIMSTFGSVTILFAMSLLYGMAGTLNFAYLARSIATRVPNSWLYLVLAMVIVGFGIKAAIVPFHTWLPDAHPEAPSSVSALLSGILITCGVYGLSRVLLLIFNFTMFHWGTAIMVLSVITMTVGNLMALLQNDLKRLLAYSSIAHIGYILTGLALGTEIGLTGAFLHIFNHALMKGLAFLCAGAFIYRTEIRDLNDLAGIGRRMPISAFTLCIALLALLGFPSLNGFVSKFILILAAINSYAYLLGIIIILNSALSAAYYLRIIQKLMVTQPTEKILHAKEVPSAMLIPMCGMAFLILLFGIWPGPLIALANNAAVAALDIQGYVNAIIGG